jgi:hypothetical protein
MNEASPTKRPGREEVVGTYSIDEQITLLGAKDASKDRESGRKTKDKLVNSLILFSAVLIVFGGITAWRHDDPRVREVAVALIGTPIGLIAGLLGGIGLR